MNEGNAVNVIYLDFSKVFDTLFHEILLEKLIQIDCDGDAAV